MPFFAAASSTKSKILAAVLSPNAFVVRILTSPSPFIAPLITLSSGCASTGTLSPVRAELSRVVVPLIMIPSIGTRSWGLTKIVEPMGTSSALTVLSTPFSSTVAKSGRIEASFSISLLETSTARSSINSPREKSIVTIAASIDSPIKNAAITAMASRVVSSSLSLTRFFAPSTNTLYPDIAVAARQSTSSAHFVQTALSPTAKCIIIAETESTAAMISKTISRLLFSGLGSDSGSETTTPSSMLLQIDWISALQSFLSASNLSCLLAKLKFTSL